MCLFVYATSGRWRENEADGCKWGIELEWVGFLGVIGVSDANEQSDHSKGDTI